MSDTTQTSSSQSQESQAGGGASDADAPVMTAFDSKRMSLTERYRARRAAEDDTSAAGGGGDAGDAVDDGGGIDPSVNTMDAGASGADGGEGDATAGGDAAPKRYTIGGKEYTEEELQAAVTRPAVPSADLEETRRLHAEMKGMADALRPMAKQDGDGDNAGGGEGGDAAPADRPAKKAVALDPEKIKQRAESLQIGDLDAGAQALADLASDIRESVVAEFNANTRGGAQLSEEEIDRRVEQRLRRADAEREVRASVDRFNDEYPDIAAKPRVKQMALEVAREHMFANWLVAGAKQSDIDKYRNKPIEEITNLHHQMMAGKVDGIKSYDEIIKGAVGEVGKELGLDVTPKSQRKSEDGKSSDKVAKVASQSQGRVVVDPAEAARRVDLKRQQQHPRTAGGRENLGGSQQRPRTARDFIQEERKRRGYPVIAR